MAHEQHAPARFAVPEPGLDPSNGIALYVQLADLWRYNIVSHKWPGGHRLDNFDLLAAEYKVARITVRQAVARLVQEGLLSTQRGRGTYVLPRAEGSSAEPPRISASSWPERLEIELLFNEPASDVPAEFRGAFEVFSAYREITKLHHLNGVPFAMVRVFVAEPIYRRFPRRAIESQKLLRLTLKHGKRAAEQMHQRMTIELADIVVAQHLHCGIGSPVAKILRQTYGTDRRLSYAGLAWYRGDAFEMDITLPRALVEDSSPALIAPGARGRKSVDKDT